MSLAFGNSVLYVSNSGEKTISVLDGTTGAAGDPITLTEEPAGIAVKDGTIFVGTTGDVTPIDEASYVIGDPIPLKGGSYFLADTGGIWVTFPLADELRWFDLKGQEPRGGPIAGVGKGIGDMVLVDDGVWDQRHGGQQRRARAGRALSMSWRSTPQRSKAEMNR